MNFARKESSYKKKGSAYEFWDKERVDVMHFW